MPSRWSNISQIVAACWLPVDVSNGSARRALCYALWPSFNVSKNDKFDDETPRMRVLPHENNSPSFVTLTFSMFNSERFRTLKTFEFSFSFEISSILKIRSPFSDPSTFYNRFIYTIKKNIKKEKVRL